MLLARYCLCWLFKICFSKIGGATILALCKDNYKTITNNWIANNLLNNSFSCFEGLRYLDICKKTVLILSSYVGSHHVIFCIPYHWCAAFLYWYVFLIRILLKTHNVPSIWGKFRKLVVSYVMFNLNFRSFRLITFYMSTTWAKQRRHVLKSNRGLYEVSRSLRAFKIYERRWRILF